MKIVKIVLELASALICGLIISTGIGFLQAFIIFKSFDSAAATGIMVMIPGSVLGIIAYLIVRNMLTPHRLAAMVIVNLVVGLLFFSFLTLLTDFVLWLLPFGTLFLIPTSIMIRMIPND